MTALPLVTPMNLSQYQRFSTFQQVSHDRHHAETHHDTSPGLGESPLPLEDDDQAPPPHQPPPDSTIFPYLTRAPQQLIYLPPPDVETPLSAPADTPSFADSSAYAYITPPHQFQPLQGTPLRPVPAAWPGLRPEHHRSHSMPGPTHAWAAAPPPASFSSPPGPAFSSPEYGTPLHRPVNMAGGVDGFDAMAYTTYPYPLQAEWEVPRPLHRERSERGSPDQGGRKHVCPVCDKRFPRPSSLQTHMSVHTGARPYACSHPNCDRRFSVSSNLRRHEKTHGPRGACASPDSHMTAAGVTFQPYVQPSDGSPYVPQSNMLEWQPAPFSAGLGHYSISRKSTRDDEPTTPETTIVYPSPADKGLQGRKGSAPLHV